MNEFSNAVITIPNVTSVGISSGLVTSLTDFGSGPIAISISKTGGSYSRKVIAENSNWKSAFLNNPKYVDLTNLDTSNITDMSGMFAHCGSLQNVGDLSNWNTSNVTDMSGMFKNCESLKAVKGLSQWNTSKVTNMSRMFENCESLQTVDNLSSWDTGKVTDMSGMFGGCSYLHTLGDLSNWDTSNVTNMSGMFYNCTSLQNVGDLSNWNTSKVTDMSLMFWGCGLQAVGDLSRWNTSKVTDMSSMFAYSALLNAGDLGKWDTRNVTSMFGMFTHSRFIYVGDLGNWNTSKVTDMVSMFEGMNNLHGTMGDLSKWDTSNVTDMTEMFASILHPYDVGDLSKWDTRHLQTTYLMFDNSQINFFAIAYGNNKVKITDFLGVLGPTGKTIAIINAPTFYKRIDGKSEAQSVYETILPMAQKKANEAYRAIYDGLSEDQKRMYPTTISLKRQYPDDIEDPEKVANARFDVYIKVPSIHINYVDDGKTVKTDQITGKVGEKINVKLALPEGYELADKNEQIPSTITLTKDGIKPIIVHIKHIPTTKVGSINYIDPDGKVVKTDQVSGKVGDKVDVKISLPDGYELANKDEQVPSTITVGDDGIGTINVNIKKINTTLADNEVPYDSTTISNNVNANYGYLDSYKLTENNQGQAQLIASGWHATGASNSDRYRYMIVFDNTLGHEIARQKLVPQVRSDVQRAYSNVDNSLYSGFNVTIDIPNSCINHSLRLVSRYSNDPNNGEGARVDYWFNPLAFNEGNQAYLDGLSSNGNALTVTGWHATNQAAGRPYHYIIAWDQNLGHEIARQKVTAVSRPDVANAYSTVANAVNSGFSVKFNLTPQFFNDNIQFISRWTDDAAGNGNAVDYWFKPMNRTNRANLDSVTLSNGQVKVAGWHATDLSQLEPNHYLIVFDNTTGQQVASEKVDLQSSQDVKNVFGDIQTADHSRFNYTFNSLHLIPGHNYSLVSRYSADATGNGNNGAHTDSWLNMGTFQQSAYSIDHVALNSRHMTIQGWVANDNAMTRPYAYAILLQNGHEIGRQQLNFSERNDVAKAYPQIYRSRYSGFRAAFNLPTSSTRGLQLVLRFTDDPAGNGNSSDKWINL